MKYIVKNYSDRILLARLCRYTFPYIKVLRDITCVGYIDTLGPTLKPLIIQPIQTTTRVRTAPITPSSYTLVVVRHTSSSEKIIEQLIKYLFYKL